ncbi:MAG: D-glycero-beta-D-manno-heptose 1-phosphate adenylyltransferase [Dissulfurispiraceae bacterium]
MEKILNWRDLREALDSLRAEKKRIVFTNGCFDIIHIGHIRYLTDAKKLGDILVVGLNSDASVRRLKTERPIIPDYQRAEVLASLHMVDYVTLFDEDTPYDLIKCILPDVLVKGGDWKLEEIIGADIVQEVHSLPFIQGVSTTHIVEKIRRHDV